MGRGYESRFCNSTRLFGNYGRCLITGKLGNISGKDAVKVFQKLGWQVIGQVGSHGKNRYARQSFHSSTQRIISWYIMRINS
jgi:hypothetical protein